MQIKFIRVSVNYKKFKFNSFSVKFFIIYTLKKIIRSIYMLASIYNHHHHHRKKNFRFNNSIYYSLFIYTDYSNFFFTYLTTFLNLNQKKKSSSASTTSLQTRARSVHITTSKKTEPLWDYNKADVAS